MSETTIWNEYKFERTVWADIQLANLCPGKDIKKIDALLTCNDTEKQFNAMMDIVLIMNEAYIRKASRIHPEEENKPLSRDILLDLDEDTFTNLTLIAMGKFKEDGEVTVLAEPKKEKAEETQSSSTHPGSSTSATP